MRVLVCPDKFKGSLSSPQAAEAIAAGFLEGWPEAETVLCPLADGGEGTLDLLVTATGGRKLPLEVTGPLGDKVSAYLGIAGDGTTAVVEMASASGLELIPRERRNPLLTTTYGTGELIRGALDLGLRRIIVAIGGSGTNDGGTGMASALGARFLDAEGRELPRGGGYLERLESMDLEGMDPRLREAQIVVAADVDNPLLGPQGATAVYAPQKGAGPEGLEVLERGLSRLARAVSLLSGRAGTSLEEKPGAGAAGGLGFGLAAFLGAEIRPGVEVVMEAVSFREKLEGCRLVITGEGKLDGQTSRGKTVAGVAREARRRGIPVLALGGEVAPEAEVLRGLGVTSLLSVVPGPLERERAMASAAEMLSRTSREVAGLLRSFHHRGTEAAVL